jgi:hypothetical protein
MYPALVAMLKHGTKFTGFVLRQVLCGISESLDRCKENKEVLRKSKDAR